LVELQKEGKVKGIGVSNYGKSNRVVVSVLSSWTPSNIHLFLIDSTNRFTC
jgi:diketogulonate reductase-like aldo/keto reductase